MKGGMESTTSMTRKVIILVIVLAICFVVANYLGFFGKVQGEELNVSTLCPTWITNMCTQESAEDGSISKTVGGGSKTLAEICEIKYDDGWLEECQKECIGCP